MADDNLKMAHAIARNVAAAGGRTYFVGGYVRDMILGNENKDIDIEIHGISVKELEGILDSLGERTAMGASFGIMGMRHYDIDIAMPRSEIAIGKGHKDFEVFVDPFIGTKKAAERRDFTINALMQDVLTGELLDHFGGIEDIKAKKLRHVNDVTFVEDPLRVFRAAQFAARFHFEVADETIQLAKRMNSGELSCERVMGELKKAILKADKPSVFFEELRKMNQLNPWFGELESLIGVPQDPEHHPEGDVWTHTMQVLDEAAKLRKNAKMPQNLMLSALVHDIGKQLVTEEVRGKIHAYKHETEGLPLVEKMIGRISNETDLKKYVLNMTELHMQPNQKAELKADRKSFMRMYDRSICPEDLNLLSKADYLGRKTDGGVQRYSEEQYTETEEMLRRMAETYRELMAQPFVMGRDLIDAGMKPGPLFGEALEYAHKLRLVGLPKEEQMKQTLGYLKKALKKQK